MRILLVSNLFPPRIIGGAEVAAHSWARWLAAQGHEVRVLTSALPGDQEGSREEAYGLMVERRTFPHLYPLGQLVRPSAPRRAIWHWQDHFNRMTRRLCAAAIAEFRPQIINCHDLQGLGYSALGAVAASGIPCVQTLHDLGFLCVNMSMFRNGAECAKQDLVCRISTRLKRHGWAGIRKLAFWSPSQALLERYRPHLPPHLAAEAIPYPLHFLAPSVETSSNPGPIRLLYVGQVTEIKGVEFILGVLAGLAKEFKFEFRVVGGGAELERLRERFEKELWVKFEGHVVPERVGDFMVQSDLLLTPSLWFENSPLVIYQAIQLGLPVLASRTGGLPELVSDQQNGALDTPGDFAAWTARLRSVFSDPAVLVCWRTGAAGRKETFATDVLGKRVLALFERTCHSAPLPVSPL